MTRATCINWLTSKHKLLLVSIQDNWWEQKCSDILSREEPVSDELRWPSVCGAKNQDQERSATLGIWLSGGPLAEQALYCQITWSEISLFLKS